MFSSLRNRLALTFITLSVVPLVIIGLVINQISFRSLETGALELQSEVSRRVATLIGTFIQERTSELELLVDYQGITTRDADAQKELLTGLLSYQTGYQQLSLLDSKGQEFIRVSRSDLVTNEDFNDYAETDIFRQAVESRAISFSPVRFDEVALEPLLTIALPMTDLRTGGISGVLLAELRFKTVWDLIAGLDLAAGEDVYVLDSQNKIVAYRNPSLVLRETTFNVPQQSSRTTGLSGGDVVLASTTIQIGGQDLTIVAERDFAQATTLASQISAISFVAVVLMLVAAVALAITLINQIVRPIQALASTAAAIQGGDLTVRAKVSARDEIGRLAGAFNSMAEQLQGVFGSMENRVSARTRELALTLEVGRLATSLSTQENLMDRLVNFIRSQFDLYYTQIYLLDDAGRYAVLRAGTGEVGQKLLERRHRLDLSETSLVARAVQASQPVLVADTQTSDIHKANPLLPDTRSEVTIPLIVGGAIIGVLDMQSEREGTFNEENLPVFEAMASQIASALRGSQAFDEAQAAIQRAEMVNRRLTEEAWESYLGRLGEEHYLGYQYDLEAPRPLEPHSNGQSDADQIVQPVVLRGQPIGRIVVAEDTTRQWKPEEMLLVADVAQRVAQALEQFRAFDQIKEAETETRKRAAELQTVAEVSAATTTLLEIDDLLLAVSDLTKERFGLYHAHIYLLDEAGENLVLAAGAGEAGRIMKAEGRSIPLNHPHSLVAGAAREQKGVVVNDVTRTPDFLPNPLLPDTKSEMAVPMLVGDQLIGVLDVQASVTDRFTSEDVRVKTTLAAQVAVAVQNARAYMQTKQQAAIIETSRDFIALADLNGKILYVNPGGLEMVSRKSFADTNIADFYPEDEYRRIEQEALPTALQVGYWRGEVSLRKTDGSTLPADETIFVVRDADGIPTNFATIITDISERKQAETEREHLLAEVQMVSFNLQERLKELAALQEIGRYGEENLPLDEYLIRVAKRVPPSMQYPDTCVSALVFDERTYGDAAALTCSTRLDQPITIAQVKRGQLIVGYLDEREFLAEETPHIMALANRVSTYLENRLLSEQTERRAAELQTVAEVSAATTTLLEIDDLLLAVSDLTKERFGLYHAHIYLLDEAGENLVLAAGAGEAGRIMKTEGRSIPLSHPHSLVAGAAREHKGVVVNDVTRAPDFLPNPLLPDTKSEMAVPMLVGDQIIGVLDVQASVTDRFTSEDVRVKTTLAAQVAVAVQNARAFMQTKQQAAVIETSRDFISMADLDGTIVYINAGGASMIGYDSPDEWVGKAIPDLHFPEDALLIQADGLPKAMQTGYWRGENGLRHRDGRRIPVDQAIFVIRDEDGEIINIATIMTDISERKQAQAILEENEARFRSLVSNVPGIIYRCAIDEFWTMQFIGPAITELTGHPDTDFIQNSVRSYASVIHPEDSALVDTAVQHGVESQSAYEIEYRIMHANGTFRWVSERGQAVYDHDGTPLWLDGAIFDITERRAQEEALRESQERFALAVEGSNDGLWDWDIVTNEVYFSPRWKNILGYEDHELTNDFATWESLVHPDDLDATKDLLNRYLGRQVSIYQPEFRMRHKDGSYRWILARAAAIWNETGQPLRLTGSHTDFTERKAQEAQLSEAIQIARIGYWEFDYATQAFTFNDQFYAMLGTTAEAEGGYVMDAVTYATRYVHADDAADVGVNVQTAYETDDPNWSTEVEARNIRTDGSEMVVLVRMHAIKDEQGRTIKLVGANQDITERKQAEAERQEQLLFLQNLIDSVPNPIFYKDSDGVYLGCNDAYLGYLGKTRAEIIGKTVYDLAPKELADTYHQQDMALLNNPDEVQIYESQVVYADGTRHDVIFNKAAYRDLEGRVSGLVGAIADITETKRVQHALQENEARLAEAVRIARIGYWEFDYATQAFTFNDQFYAMLGTTAEAEGGYVMNAMTYATKWVHPDDAADVGVNVQTAYETDDPNWSTEIEARNIRTDGSEMVVLVRMHAVKDEQGRTIKLVGANQDITERKQAEAEREHLLAEVQRNARLIRTVIDATPDWIFAKDRDYRYLLANQGYATAIGTTTDGIVGKTDVELGFPEEIVFGNPDKGIRGFRSDDEAVLTTSESIFNPYDPATFADGSIHIFDTQKMPLRDTDGETFAVLGFARDITLRQQQEEEIRLAREEAEILYQVSSAINEAKTPQDIVDAITAYAAPPAKPSISVVTFDSGDVATAQYVNILANRMSDGQTMSGLRIPLADFASSFIGSPDEIMFLNDTQNDPRLSEESRIAYRAFNAESALTAPLEIGGHVAGSISVTTAQVYHFTERDVRIYRAIAEQTAAALERLQLIEETQKRAAELETVARVSTATTTILDIEELLQAVSDLTKESFHLYHAHIYLLDETGEKLMLAAGAGDAGRIMKAESRFIPINHPNSLVARAARERKGVIANDVTLEPDFLPNPLLPLTQSEMAIPMIVAAELIGVLDVQSEITSRFTEEDVRIKTTLADQVGIAIQNARAYRVQQDAADRLREVDRLKSQFLANMSHELRTPLNSIIGYAEVMLDGIDGELTDDAIEDVEAIHSGGKHLLSIINDILDLAKIDAGQMFMDRQEANLSKIVEEVVHTCQILIKDKGIYLEMDRQSEIPPVYGDPVRLRQIVTNLVNNAIKFTEKGGITISIGQQDDQQICVTVKDTGIGMSQKDLNVIFERFRQVDGSATRRAGGTGLGLAITRQLVQMHDGDIHVSSIPGEGSTFSFTLPVYEGQKV